MSQRKNYLVESERNDRGGRKRSHGDHNRPIPDEAVGRRPRGLESNVVRILVESTSGRAPGLDQAAMASDRPRGREAPNTVKERNKRPTREVEDPDSSDSSDDETVSTTSDTSTGSSSSLDIPLPDPYDGRPDQRAFDAWVDQVTFFVEYYKLSDDQVMYMLRRLVSGEAKSCFMSHFTPSRYLQPRERSLKEVFKVLQEECFPSDHKMTLHKQLMSATQGNLGVSDFADELRFRAKHLPYVNEQCLAAIFFVGVHKYIRVGLIMDGMEQDGTDLETLVKYALRYERARRELRSCG